MKENKNDLGMLLIGITAGGLVAGITALLFAPKSGKETRRLIRDKSIELNDKAHSKVEEKRIQIEESLEKAKQKVEELKKVVENQAIELQEKSKKIINEKRAELAEFIVPKG